MSDISLVVPDDESGTPADITLRNIGCTVSRPGSCRYTIAGCGATFVFQIPYNSIDLSVPVDTLDESLLKRADDGFTIDAQSMYGKENRPDEMGIEKEYCFGYSRCSGTNR